MRWSPPKNDAKYAWTNHSARKMVFYVLSPDRVKRIIRNPFRTEEGIVPGTVVAMQKAGTAKKPTEIWVMYKEEGKISKIPGLGTKKLIITAWRYPGISKVRSAAPIPTDIISELKSEGLI